MGIITEQAKRFIKEKRRRNFDRIGQWVQFDSPLFGLCTGLIIEVEADFYTVTDHSVIKDRVKIPIAWVEKPTDDQRPEGMS